MLTACNLSNQKPRSYFVLLFAIIYLGTSFFSELKSQDLTIYVEKRKTTYTCTFCHLTDVGYECSYSISDPSIKVAYTSKKGITYLPLKLLALEQKCCSDCGTEERNYVYSPSGFGHTSTCKSANNRTDDHVVGTPTVENSSHSFKASKSIVMRIIGQVQEVVAQDNEAVDDAAEKKNKAKEESELLNLKYAKLSLRWDSLSSAFNQHIEASRFKESAEIGRVLLNEIQTGKDLKTGELAVHIGNAPITEIPWGNYYQPNYRYVSHIAPSASIFILISMSYVALEDYETAESVLQELKTNLDKNYNGYKSYSKYYTNYYLYNAILKGLKTCSHKEAKAEFILAVNGNKTKLEDSHYVIELVEHFIPPSKMECFNSSVPKAYRKALSSLGAKDKFNQLITPSY